MRLGKAIESRFGVTPRLVAGSGGVFDVIVDGHKIFSKHETHTFPDEDDLIAAMGKR